MKNTNLISLFLLSTILILCAFRASATPADSVCPRSEAVDSLPRFTWLNTCVPTALMTWGAIEASAASTKWFLNSSLQNEVVKRRFPKFKYDDYMQYAPGVAVYALNMAGVKSRHSLGQCTAILAMAAAMNAITVNSMKYTVRELRPDGSSRNSFPSGHTTTAFMMAEFMRTEYSHLSPWYGIGAYVTASATGLLRIYNNRHWAGDVFFGAGLGIMCTRTAYWLYPRLRNHFKNNKNSVALAPFANGSHQGLSLAMKF